jgi:hypothetical protein
MSKLVNGLQGLPWVSCAWACSLPLFAPHVLHLCSVSYLHIAIGHTEQGLEEPPEPAPVEAGDHEQNQGKPQCI